MAQTFDIRFAKTPGLAALLEVPENRFRWKGGGLLRIDSRGISIGLKRGLLTLLGGKRTQRIPTKDLRAVYREGEALRVEYQSGTANVVLPFWADNRDAAAQIVRMLPTRQTVEIEETTDSPKPRADWRLLSTLVIALAAIAVGTWAVYQRNSPAVPLDTAHFSNAPATAKTPALTTQVPATAAQNVDTSAKPARPKPWYEAPAIPLDPRRSAQVHPARSAFANPAEAAVNSVSTTEIAAGANVQAVGTQKVVVNPPTWDVRATSEGIVPFVPGMPGYTAARRQLDLFLAEAATLRYYASPEEGWWKVMERIHNSPDFKDTALIPLKEIELAVSRAWLRAYSMQNHGPLAAYAPAEFEFADMLEARANEFVN